MAKFKTEEASGYISTCLWVAQHSSQKHKAFFMRRSKLFYYTFGATSHRQRFFNTNWIRKRFYFSFLLFLHLNKVFFFFLIYGPCAHLWIYDNPETYIHKRCPSTTHSETRATCHCRHFPVAVILQSTSLQGFGSEKPTLPVAVTWLII